MQEERQTWHVIRWSYNSNFFFFDEYFNSYNIKQ